MARIKMTTATIQDKINNTLKFETTTLNELQQNIILGVNKKNGVKIKAIELNKDNKRLLLEIIYKHLSYENWKTQVDKWLEADDFWGAFNNNSEYDIKVENKTGRIKYYGCMYIIENQQHILITKVKNDDIGYCFM